MNEEAYALQQFQKCWDQIMEDRMPNIKRLVWKFWVKSWFGCGSVKRDSVKQYQGRQIVQRPWDDEATPICDVEFSGMEGFAEYYATTARNLERRLRAAEKLVIGFLALAWWYPTDMELLARVKAHLAAAREEDNQTEGGNE